MIPKRNLWGVREYVVGRLHVTFHDRDKHSTGWDRMLAVKWAGKLGLFGNGRRVVFELVWFAIGIEWKDAP
jgi:hypothetical protein